MWKWLLYKNSSDFCSTCALSLISWIVISLGTVSSSFSYRINPYPCPPLLLIGSCSMGITFSVSTGVLITTNKLITSTILNSFLLTCTLANKKKNKRQSRSKRKTREEQKQENSKRKKNKRRERTREEKQKSKRKRIARERRTREEKEQEKKNKRAKARE